MESLLRQLIKDLFGLDTEPVFTRPAAQFGDYATNVAMQLAKKLGKNPREIAEQIVEELRKNEDFTEVSVAGPGFINIRLSDAALIRQIYTRPQTIRKDETIVIETNNPNPFKAMHIGHAYNAVLGDTIANLLAVSGGKVYRVSYHGDVGLHVGKSMYSLLRYADGDIKKIEAIEPSERNSFMSNMYAEGSKAYKEDEAAKAEINELAKQSFAPQTAIYTQIYEMCKTWSFEQIDALVARLGNVPTERRFLESDSDLRGVKTVKDNTPNVFKESDGALIFEGSKHGSFDNAFVASNGHGLYGARDIGLIQLKNEYFHPVKSYIVTGEEQNAYFRGVIAAADQLWPDNKGVTVNIPTGLVKLSTGKMSSRDGDVVEVAWLFDEFKKAIEARGSEGSDEIVAGALRYQFLKVKIGSDVVFDINEAVSLTGNTGSYLQYAHARARSILSKSTASFSMPQSLFDEDRDLIRKLGEYHDVVNVSTRSLEPHHICTYLFELAQEFNRYYEKNKVIGGEKEAHRISIVGLYADILKAGLAILGVEAPERL